MAFLNILGIAEQITLPTGLWEWLILNLFSFISNYGWRVLVFVICLKLVLFPLDVYQRVMMRKNQKITERMAPQLEKLKLQYGNDKTVFQQKQMELNKKEGFSYFSSCLPMIVTLVIFIWLFQGLTNISQFMNVKQYLELYDKYTITETTILTENNYSEDPDIMNQDEQSRIKKLAQEGAQQAVVDFYNNENKESFLWIKNLWSADVPWKKPIMEYKDFTGAIGAYGTKAGKLGLDETQFNSIISSDTYNRVTERLQMQPDNKTNGLLILPILSVGFSFLSQFITTRLQKKSGQTDATGSMAGSMKVMMFIMPLIMGFFALTYTSAFTLYIVVNSGMTILLNLLTTGIMGIANKYEKRAPSTDVIVKYGRPDPNEVVTNKKDKKETNEISYTKKKGVSDIKKYGRPDPNDRGKNGKPKK